MQITATITFNITAAPLAVTMTTFNDTVGTPATGTLGVTGGTPPYVVAVTDPTKLPPGITIATDGDVSGTPTASGTFSVPVTVTDAAG